MAAPQPPPSPDGSLLQTNVFPIFNHKLPSSPLSPAITGCCPPPTSACRSSPLLPLCCLLSSASPARLFVLLPTSWQKKQPHYKQGKSIWCSRLLLLPPLNSLEGKRSAPHLFSFQLSSPPFGFSQPGCDLLASLLRRR